jgi:hypothetical protein
VALESPQPQATRPNQLAITLWAALLLAVLGNLGFGMASATGGTGHSIESAVAMGSDLVGAGNTRLSDDNCGRDHKSAECAPCPSCSGALPSTAAGNSQVILLVRTLILQSHYDDVVPSGIRRPPKLS